MECYLKERSCGEILEDAFGNFGSKSMLVLELQERILRCKEKCMDEVKASACTAIAMRARIGRIIGEMARRLPANTQVGLEEDFDL